ncbi:MAG: nicotinate-nucleotide diphosphorylase (carboxylating) [Lysobacteraceae bacterium]|nr:MAG: nicotinate-nucleotide diphosphorylase (carboxylating) [Xanthomonadaceae bacterium]
MMTYTHSGLADDVARAIAEDVGDGDLTAMLIPESTDINARVICRDAATIAGQPWFDETFRQIDSGVTVDWAVAEGAAVAENTLLCQIHGSARSVLTAERTALNFLQTLSATATATARCVAQLAGTSTRLLDTRKTIPGLRMAQKYAVAIGGGSNHRIGLHDAVLIKENHIMAAGSISAAVKAARDTGYGNLLEVEVETLPQLEEAIGAGAQRALLDNFSNDELLAAVEMAKGTIELEASGGFELDDLAAVAATGVDFISVGAITKHIHAVDLSMRFQP